MTRIMMVRSWFATTVLLTIAVSGTSAVFCNFMDTSDDGSHTVSTQEELGALLANCTEILGYVNIAANYTGSFYFPNVRSMKGGISTPEAYTGIGGSEGHELTSIPLLTSVEAPDLNEASFISLKAMPGLTAISFPSLTVVNGSLDIAGIEDCQVDFPLLETVTTDLTVSGKSNRLNFPLLTDGGNIRVSTIPYNHNDGTYDNILRFHRDVQEDLDINFPSLQNAKSIYLQGNIHSLSMPLLNLIGNDLHNPGQIKIVTYGHALSILLPKLTTVWSIIIAGTIISTSFPALLGLSTFQLNSSIPFDVDLAPIQSLGGALRLVGNISSVSMSSITTYSNLDIDSEYSGFYCSSIASDVERIKEHPMSQFECSGHPPKNTQPLKMGLGIGFGSLIVLGLVYYVYWECWSKRKEQKLKHNKPLEYELGAPPTYTTEGPPTYDASERERGAESERERVGEQGSADATRGRMGDSGSLHGQSASEHIAGDAASTCPGDGSSIHQEGGLGRRVV